MDKEQRRKKDRARYHSHADFYRKKARLWRKEHPGRTLSATNRALMSRYGITAEERKDLYVSQKGRCKNPKCRKKLRTKRASIRMC